ncbi:14658_t:CDS:1, partial [Funneliformis caledonium]
SLSLTFIILKVRLIRPSHCTKYIQILRSFLNGPIKEDEPVLVKFGINDSC